ncbi:MAG: PhzF family isomerase [Candidatus Delongbacteria bacterium]|nr:PhzF family isomerase [Candidatus Delongbacteria bacterium]
MDLTVYQVDAFTKELFSGNPAGVVPNADSLDVTMMQKIARELNNSETAFIIHTPSPDFDIEVRFFTPTHEVPICGHATISAHYIYAKEKNLAIGRIIQKTKAGILPVELIPEEDDLRIVMTQAGIVFGTIIEGNEKDRLLEGLGLSDSDLDDSLPIQIVSTGHSKVMIPIKSKHTLDRLIVKNEILANLSRIIGCNGYYTFTFDSREDGILTSGRMFAPVIGIMEDPVTGNANGPLGAYLTHYNRIEKCETGFIFQVKQGEAIGRKGYMKVHVYSRNDEPELVKVSGNARIVFKTVIRI